MIVYLGMPKCASTWLYNKIKKNFDYNGKKEPHTLVEYGTKNNNMIDFSTNNWSMDSSTALKIDNDVSKYIFIVRDPIELATSYYMQTKLKEESFNDFVFSLVKTKFICFGDIIERWYKLVDKKKILIYDYNKDIQGRHKAFISDVCKNLNLDSYDQTMPLQDKIFETHNKPQLTCTDKNLNEIIKTQFTKFKQITQG